MATLGLKNLYFAPIDMSSGVEVYGTPQKMASVISADLSVTVAEATLYADDAIFESAKKFTKGTLTLNTADLDASVTASILGQSTDESGITWAAGTDIAPYVAVGFCARKSDGTYRFIWLMKAQFGVPSESFETEGESINFKTPEITATFMAAIGSGLWKADYVGTLEDEVGSTWFDAVPSQAAA